MDIITAIGAAIAGYLMGSISFTHLVTRLVSPQTDLTKIEYKDEQTGETHRTRTTSATYASMALGGKVGCTISLLDMAKVALVTLAFRLFFPGQPYFLIAAAFGVVGNNWPVFFRFRGGAGISAIYGGMAVVDPLGILATTLAGLIVGALILRSVISVFFLCLLFIIPWLWIHFHQTSYLIYGIAINCFFLATLLPEVIDIIRTGKYKKGINDRSIMMGMPMGRGMYRMMDRLKFQKKST